MKKGLLFSLFAAVALLGASLAVPSNERSDDGAPSIREDDQLARCGGRGRLFHRRGGCGGGGVSAPRGCGC